MKPPFIVSESGDISIFKSVFDAERYLESPDVIDGRYIVYDSEGHLLKLEAMSQKSTSLLGLNVVQVGKVSISSGEAEAPRTEELRQSLVGFLVRLSAGNDWLKESTLQEVLAKTIEMTGFTE